MRTLNKFQLIVIAGLLWAAGNAAPAHARSVVLQAPTPTLPPNRVEVIDDFANVRAGPGTDYDLVGRLNRGQLAEIVGQAQMGQFLWVQVMYIGGPETPGWVNTNSGAVSVVGSLETIPRLTPPPTPTLPPTATSVDGFAVSTATPDPNAGRLPTFTPPPAVVRPTLLPAIGIAGEQKLPPALAIISLLVLGLFGLLISFLRQRS